MKEIYIDRLNKIVDHLQHGKLGHKEFDFSVLHLGFNNNEKRQKRNKGFCGSAGCALGEFPIIFPRHFHFFNGDVSLRKEHTEGLGHYIMEFLDIVRYEYYHLFSQGCSLKPGGKVLLEYATKEQVADNILDFIKYKQRNGK